MDELSCCGEPIAATERCPECGRKVVWIHRTESGRMKVRQSGRERPRDGRLFAVRALGRFEAERTLTESLRREPDEVRDPAGWTAWRAARRRVVEVTRG